MTKDSNFEYFYPISLADLPGHDFSVAWDILVELVVAELINQPLRLNKILQILRHVIPYHQAAILVVDEMGLGFLAHSGYRQAPNRADDVLTSPTYSLIMKYRQAIYFPNASKVPAWRGMGSLGSPMAWMGVPLLQHGQPIGLLSISRNVERAYDSDERNIAFVFAKRISEMLRTEKQEAGQLDPAQESLAFRFQPEEVRETRQKHQDASSFDVIFEEALETWRKYG